MQNERQVVILHLVDWRKMMWRDRQKGYKMSKESMKAAMEDPEALPPLGWGWDVAGLIVLLVIFFLAAYTMP